MSTEQIPWEHLREVPLADLRPGDSWITLAPFTVCWASADGRVRGHGWQQPQGTVWTLRSWDGDTITAVSENGETRSQQIPSTVMVNRIIGAAPKPA